MISATERIMRAFLVPLMAFLLHEACFADIPLPYRDSRTVSYRKKYYVVVRDMLTDHGVVFEYARSSDTKVTNQSDQLIDLWQRVRNPRVVVRDKDVKLSSGLLAFRPARLLVLDGGTGFIAIGEHTPSRAGNGITFVDRTGVIKFEKSMNQLFSGGPLLGGELSMMPNSAHQIDFCWVDESKGKIVLVSPRLGEVSGFEKTFSGSTPDYVPPPLQHRGERLYYAS